MVRELQGKHFKARVFYTLVYALSASVFYLSFIVTPGLLMLWHSNLVSSVLVLVWNALTFCTGGNKVELFDSPEDLFNG